QERERRSPSRIGATPYTYLDTLPPYRPQNIESNPGGSQAPSDRRALPIRISKRRKVGLSLPSSWRRVVRSEIDVTRADRNNCESRALLSRSIGSLRPHGIYSQTAARARWGRDVAGGRPATAAKAACRSLRRNNRGQGKSLQSAAGSLAPFSA